MDSNSVLTTHINLPTPTPTPTPSSVSTTTTKQQQHPYISDTLTGNTQLPASINQLRTFSTALSEFISRYDELNNHIGFINLSIDSNLPPNCVVEGINNPSYLGLLETSCDRTVVDVTEGVVSVRNPRERVSDCELRHADARTTENDSFSRGFDETDASKKPEVANNNVEIDTRGREIGVSENHVEIDSLKGSFSHGYDELDASKKVEVADESEDPEEIEEEIVSEGSCDGRMVVVREAIVSEENPNGMVANGERSNENVRAPEWVEESDVSKKPEEIDICRNAEESVMLKKHEEFDTTMIPEEIEILKMCEEVVVVKKLEETVLDNSCDQSIAIVSEQKPNVMAMRTPESFEEVEALKKPAVIDVPKKVEATDIGKNSEQIELLQEPEELDTLRIPEEIGTLKKHEKLDISMVSEDTDTSKKPEECLLETSRETRTMVPEAIVSDHLNQMTTDCEQSHENVSILENLEEIDVCKKPEQTDILKKHEEIGICKIPKETVVLEMSEKTGTLKKRKKNGTCKKSKKCKASKKSVVSNGKQSHEKVRTPEHLEEIDILNKPEQTDICKNPAESTVLKKPEELDIAVISEEIDTSKNPEESLPETSCDHTSTVVQEAIESEQNPNTMAANGKPSHEIVMTPKCHEETDVSVPKKPEQTAVSKKPEQTDILNKPQETVVSKKLKKINTLKKHKENGACKKAKETKAHTKTVVPEASVSEQNPNRMAANGKPSYENVMTHECLEETEVSAPKQPEQTVVPKKPEQTDILNKPQETVVSKKLKKISTLKKHEENGTSKKAKETKAHATTVVPEAIVSKQNPNRMAANGKPNHENAMAPECLQETDVSVPKKPEQTVASKRPEQTVASKKPEQTDILNKPEQIVVSKKPEQTAILNKPEQPVVSKQLKKTTTLKKHEENGTCKKVKETEAPKNFVISMLQSLCRGMCSKDMKGHVATHYSKMINHREEIAKSLKLAKDPAKLVLNSIGRFFIQGSKTFCNPHNKESQGRMAAVLILECFVMISSDDGIEIAKRDQQYAAEAAVDWKKRMIREGGLKHAVEVDARGLLLLISGFRIEDHAFKIQDIIHLIRASNVKGIATALRHSAFLISKVTEVIHMMMNDGLEIEAVDIAYTFGLEHTCHPGKILTAYLQNKIKDFQNASDLQMLEAAKQHLFDLTLVKQCLESHNVDPSMLLPDFKINERIENLEKVVNECKLNQKRRSLENPIHQEAKRACYGHGNMPHHHKPVDHCGMDRLNRSTQPSTSYITKHSAPPVYNAYARPEHRNGSVPNGMAGGFHGSYDQTVHMANSQPHGWHGPYGQSHGWREPYGQPHGWQGPHGQPQPIHGQTYGQPRPRHGQTYGSQPDHRPWEQGQPESFPGFLGSRPPPSGLYGFAELVEKGLRGSRA